MMTMALPKKTRGLRRIRYALSVSHARLDRDRGTLPTRDFAIPTAWGDLKARLYEPVPSSLAGPGLVFFHGGGFVVCDLETHDALCRRLAEAAGMRIVSVAYRLAPEAAFPAQLDDGEAAINWVKANGLQLGIDPEHVLAGGDSAGGYIALAATMTLNTTHPGTVTGLMLIYPLLELGDDAWASSLFAHSRIVGRVAVSYIRGQLQLKDLPESLAEIDLSPIPSSLIVVGGPLDPCRPDARKLAARLREAGKLAGLLEYARLPHGFASLTHLSRASSRAVDQIGETLARLAPGGGTAAEMAADDGLIERRGYLDGHLS
jgi:acetyl esterase